MSITHDEHLEYVREQRNYYTERYSLAYDLANMHTTNIIDLLDQNDSIGVVIYIRNNIPATIDGKRAKRGLLDAKRIMEVVREHHDNMPEQTATEAIAATLHLLIMTQAPVV